MDSRPNLPDTYRSPRCGVTANATCGVGPDGTEDGAVAVWARTELGWDEVWHPHRKRYRPLCWQRKIRVDLTAKRFGRLTVLGPAPIKSGESWWIVRCRSGTEKQRRRSLSDHRGHPIVRLSPS